jgi:hypothetical protein
VAFVKVDGDRFRSLGQQYQVTGFPTFIFFQGSSVMDRFSGAAEEKLRSLVSHYAAIASAPPLCPYKHFPLQSTESVSFSKIKYSAVLGLLEKNNASLLISSSPLALNPDELHDLKQVLNILDDKKQYQSTAFSSSQYSALDKVFHWPVASLTGPLNLLRGVLLHPHAAVTYATRLCPDPSLSPAQASEELGEKPDLINRTCSLVASLEKPVQVLLAVRALANFFSRQRLKKTMLARYERVLDSLASCLANQDTWDAENKKDIKMAVISVFINFAIGFNEAAEFAVSDAERLFLEFQMQVLL